MLGRIHPEVQTLVDALNLRVVSVFQDGPRYGTVLVTTADDQEAVLKAILSKQSAGKARDEQTRKRELERAMIKEIRWMRFIDAHRGELDETRFMFPRLIDASEHGTHWYLREALPGPAMASPNNPFPLPKTFYDVVQPEHIFSYFVSIHRLSRKVPPELTEMFWHRWTRYDQYDHFFQWLRGMLPKVEQGKDLLAPIISHIQSKKFIIEQHQTVITHQEPFASHIFYHSGKLGLIDWENVDFGHKLHDLSSIWMRAFDNPAWQREFMEVISAGGYLSHESQFMWDLEVLMQSVGNLVYFQLNQVGTAAYQAAGVKFFSENIEAILKSQEG